MTLEQQQALALARARRRRAESEQSKRSPPPRATHLPPDDCSESSDKVCCGGCGTRARRRSADENVENPTRTKATLQAFPVLTIASALAKPRI